MAASPLTKARTSGSLRNVNRDKRPLQAGVKAWKGGLAAVNAAGFYGPATGAASEIVVGRFYRSVDNSAGANGDKLCDVEHFYERWVFLVDNDTVTPVTVAARERLCQILDDHTATLAAGGSGAVVYDVTSEGVWIDISPASGGNAFASGAVPRVQKGTTTLIAGTKTITGVVLTADSAILLTMRDPGAGAITNFAALDAPAASRNAGTGQFVINAIDNAKAVIGTAVCTVDYLIVG